MTNFELLSLISAFGIPLLGLMLARQDRHRQELYAMLSGRIAEMHAGLMHIDKCVDDMKAGVIAKMASKSDLVEQRSQVNAVIIREREITSQDTGGLEKRIFRLENRGLAARTKAA